MCLILVQQLIFENILTSIHVLEKDFKNTAVLKTFSFPSIDGTQRLPPLL